MRIQVPTNPDQLIELALAIVAQHKRLGVASPLSGIKGIADFEPQATAADAANKDAKDFAKKSEAATEARDNALGPDTLTLGCVRYFVTAARDVLVGTNKGAEHVLGDWGFVVDESPQLTPEQKAAAKAARAAANAVKKNKSA